MKKILLNLLALLIVIGFCGCNLTIQNNTSSVGVQSDNISSEEETFMISSLSENANKELKIIGSDDSNLIQITEVDDDSTGEIIQMPFLNSRSGIRPESTLSAVKDMINVTQIRKCNEIDGYYSVHYNQSDKSFMIIFYENKKNMKKALVTAVITLQRIVEKTAFDNLEIGKSTVEDVKNIDSFESAHIIKSSTADGYEVLDPESMDEYGAVYYDGSFSYHIADNGYILVDYQQNDEKTIKNIRYQEDSYISSINKNDIPN